MTAEEHQNLLAAERKLNDVLPDIDGLEECGVDCQQLRAYRQQRMDQIAALKKNFAPSKLV